MMNVILLQRVDKLGQMGDVVTVKPGYARNFLLPQGIALRATDENKAVFEAKRAQLEADNLKRREEAEDMAGRMEGLSIPMIRQASDTGQLYGSVTTRDIAGGISEAGFTINSGQVLLDRAIKTLGVHTIRVKVHPEVDLMVNINVAKSEEEALGLVVEEEEDDFGDDLEFGAFDNEDGDVVITRSDDEEPAAEEAAAEESEDE